MLGSKLKEAREARQVTLREIEWATKIRADYLQALEDEDFALLPSATHVRGFIRSYARYLDIDSNPLVEEFNNAGEAATEIVSTRRSVGTRQRDFAVTPGMIVGAALIILIGVFGFYLKHQFDKYQASRVAEAQPSPGLRLSDLPSPTALPTPTAVPAPVPSPSPSPTGVALVVHVDVATWLHVDVDGKSSPQTDRIFPAGTILNFQGNASVRIISGVPAHTFVTVNGKVQGAMPASNKTYTRGQT